MSWLEVVLLLLIYFKNIEGWRTFTIKLTNATGISYSNKFNLNLTINDNKLDIHFIMKETVAHPTIRAEMFLQSPGSGRYDDELMNRTIDLCKFYENRLYEPLLQIMYQIILESGDFPKSCPVKAKHYYIEQVHFDPDRFPPYLPERKGYIKLSFCIKENNQTILILVSTLYVCLKGGSFTFVRGK
ncbi:hypothetical protein Bhyg_17845, partial [Pseudolycoriella hygida]